MRLNVCRAAPEVRYAGVQRHFLATIRTIEA
jgi:hypothetical protein